MAKGYTYKRCPHGITGTPSRGQRDAVLACREKHGTWWYRVEAGRDPVTGKRIQPARGGFATRNEAQAELNDHLTRIATGTVTDDKGLTVAAWLERWLKTGRWKPTTRRGYQADIEQHIIPLLGSIRLRDLRRRHVRGMLAEIARYDEERAKAPGRGGRIVAQRSGETVDKARRTLRSALSAAVRDDMITVNPAQGRFDEIPARGQGETVMWQPDDVRKFLAHIADDPLAALWTVAAFTGLRRGELCGLRWADVDLEAEVPGIVIRQTVVAVPGSNPCPVCEVLHRGRIIQGSAKSTAGVRWVPLTSDSTSELLAHQIKQETHRADVGELYVNHGLVFAMASGEPLRPDAVTKRHGVLVAQAGLPQIKLHAMRHGAVSMLAAAGLTDELIALIVGHSSAQVTRDVYLHGIRGQLGDAAEAAAKLVRGDTP